MHELSIAEQQVTPKAGRLRVHAGSPSLWARDAGAAQLGGFGLRFLMGLVESNVSPGCGPRKPWVEDLTPSGSLTGCPAEAGCWVLQVGGPLAGPA